MLRFNIGNIHHLHNKRHRHNSCRCHVVVISQSPALRCALRCINVLRSESLLFFYPAHPLRAKIYPCASTYEEYAPTAVSFPAAPYSIQVTLASPVPSGKTLLAADALTADKVMAKAVGKEAAGAPA